MTHQPARVVGLARGWLGTPYLHQASLRGVGADCLGLVRGIWREIYGSEPAPLPAYDPDWAEPGRDEVLMRALQQHMIHAAAPMASGDVVLFRMRTAGIAKHLGVVAEDGARLTFIHAYCGHGTVESPLTQPWRRRIVARFQFP